jgi:hypothetical protein
MPTATNNGTEAAAPAPLTGRRRLHAVPQTREYEIERGREVVVLQGFVAGPACPIWVSIEVQAAVDAYNAANAAIPTGSRRVGDYIAPALRQRQAILCAVIRGLAEEEAAVLAADGGEWEPILVELGWWKPAEAAAEEDDADPEATGELPTSADSSPASASTTPEPTS